MKISFYFLATTVLLFSCNTTSEKKEEKKKGKHTVTDSVSRSENLQKEHLGKSSDSTTLPSFSIQLDLNEHVIAKTFKNQETIILDAVYLGVPKDKNIENYDYQTMGKLPIANHQIEISNNQVVTFAQVKVSKDTLAQLEHEDVEVSINVFTGRKTSEMNLISCQHVQKKLSEFTKDTTTLTCKPL